MLSDMGSPCIVLKLLSLSFARVGAGASPALRAKRLSGAGGFAVLTAEGGRPYVGIGEFWTLCQLCFLPAYLLTLVLYIQPFLQRGEIFQDRSGIYMTLAGQDFQCFGPGLALAHG